MGRKINPKEITVNRQVFIKALRETSLPKISGELFSSKGCEYGICATGLAALILGINADKELAVYTRVAELLGCDEDFLWMLNDRGKIYENFESHELATVMEQSEEEAREITFPEMADVLEEYWGLLPGD